LVITSDRDRDLADDSYTIRFTTVGGLEGSVSTSAAAWGGPVSFCRILGSKGTLWIKDLIPRGAVETTSGPVILADAAGVREVVVPEDLRLPLTPAEVDQRVHPAVRPYSRLYREMVDDIEGRRVASSDGSSTLPATFADGVHVMEILDALRVSSKHGGENVAFNIAENS
jgi:predicted dehydrogenase